MVGRLHLHKRKPGKDKYKAKVDKLVYAVSILVLALTIPQIYNIWFGKNAAGVSIISWGAYTLSAAVWTFYGIIHKDKPIIITSTVWILFDIAIVIGTLIYG